MQEYEIRHRQRVREISPECMVLLRSNGDFPLEKPGKIALYGNGARRTVRGGTGSGEVNVREFSTVEEGLRNAGFEITTFAWLDAYDTVYENARKAFTTKIREKISREGMSALLSGMGAVMEEPEYELPMDGEGDTAIYVLARISGEGSDRKAVAGDFFLNRTEINNILTLQKTYRKFLLVLNVGGVVDLSPVAGEVSNILLLSQLGSATGDAFADVLLGKAAPSGKLASTWAAWEDYCSVGDFARTDDTRYREGIYVGYRYFDSVGKEPLFPFGYGLSYTTFTLRTKKTEVEEGKVHVTVTVKNTGNRPGREVVQLYVSVPEKTLDQPYQTLAAFEKTKELLPGEEQSVTLSFALWDLASFDAAGAEKILESGSYILRVGNSSRDTRPVSCIRLRGDVVAKKLQHVGGAADFTDWKPERKSAEAGEEPGKDMEDVWENLPVLELGAEEVCPPEDAVKKELEEYLRKAKETAETMTDEELAYLCVGGFVDQGSSSVIGNAAMTVAGAAGETTGRFLAEKKIPPLVMADGPAGLRLSPKYGVDEKGVYSVDENGVSSLAELLPPEILAMFQAKKEEKRGGVIYEQYCTAIPIGMALAQSWNPQVCQSCGDLVGEEMERFGVHLWLAPALNIHRHPLCGRNFEYYSEDPLISGKMAAGITRGVQRHPGRGVTVKHFVCNNQETNRFRSNSVVSERALRDMYLRGFEIVIREAAPAAVMSSYNLLNGEHTSQRYDLMETVLRKEWNYEGIVMSDWVTGGLPLRVEGKKYPGACASGSIRAGNDIMMPGGPADHADLMRALREADSEYPLKREHLEKCASRMIAMARKLADEAEDFKEE